MIYEYRCKHGHGSFDVIKPANRSEISERCPLCKSQALKVFSTKARVEVFKEGYYHAFGQEIRTKGQLRAAMYDHKVRTGNEVIEIGNEKIKRRPLKKPDIEAAQRELRHAIR